MEAMLDTFDFCLSSFEERENRVMDRIALVDELKQYRGIVHDASTL